MIQNGKEFETSVNKQIRDRYPVIGETIVNKIKILMEANIGRPSKLTDSVNYEIDNDEIVIISKSPVAKFLDEGTKPHIIRPKKTNGALKFKVQETVIRKDGTKLGFGDEVIVKEVKHPGFPPREFISQALFLTQKEFPDILFHSSTPTKSNRPEK